MTEERRYRDHEGRMAYDAMTLEERVDWLAEKVCPGMFRLLPKPKPGPLDNLWDPAPSHLSERDLQTRFMELTRDCYLLSEREVRQAAWDDYSIDMGLNLPARYRDEDGRVIDKTRGDITDDLEFLRVRDRITEDLHTVEAQIEEYLQPNGSGVCNEAAAESLKPTANEIRLQLVDHYNAHNHDLPSWLVDFSARQERLADL